MRGKGSEEASFHIESVTGSKRKNGGQMLEMAARRYVKAYSLKEK